jgi:small subunit ribosomal protein S17
MPKRRIEGVVVSDKMDKTAVVRVERIKQHPLYRKYLRRHSRFMAHDEQNEARIGDRVIIEECRPMSRSKRWLIVEWLKRGESA